MSFNKKRKYLTYGTVISFMLDYSDISDYATISYDPENIGEEASINKSTDLFDFFTSRDFLYTNGVFNEYCFYYRFKNKQDIKDNYINTLFLVLPAFEFDSMNNLRQMIKKIQRNLNEASEQQIIDYYKRFKQEIQTNHDKSINLMKPENNKLNYNDCVQFLHLKSGKFLEYKSNSKNLKTYIQLSNNMSQRTIFRFIPAFNYQSETSTNVFFYLAIQIACGDKKSIREKFIVNENISDFGKYSEQKKFCFDGTGKEYGENEKEDNKKKENISKKSIFDGENLRNTMKAIYNDETMDNKIIDEFVAYSINENLPQKNFGVKLMPENNYVNVDYSSFSFWRLINFSEDYFEDAKYINLFDYFSIQNIDKNLFIHLESEENEEQNYNLLYENINNTRLFPIKEENEELNDNKSFNKNNEFNNNINNDIINESDKKNESENKNENKDEVNEDNNNLRKNEISVPLIKDLGYIANKNSISDSTVEFLDYRIDLDYFFNINFFLKKNYKLMVDSYDNKDKLMPYSLFKFEILSDNIKKIDVNNGLFDYVNIMTDNISVRIKNVFTNKYMYVDKIKNNCKLFLIDDIEKNDKRYPNTIFQIERIKETKEIYEKENEKEEENKDNNEKDSNKEENTNGIKKDDYIKIYSKKINAYIGIRIRNDNNFKELILTNSMSDITKFKLNCLDEEDKYELNFFEQLLLSLNNILVYFNKENRTNIISGKNYERIKHILITLRNKLNQFNNDVRDVTNLNLQKNKFDFLEMIKQFNIVSKLIEIFLTNWFGNYQLYSYNHLENIIKKYFTENKDILKYKLLISREILQILTIIYDFKPCYLNIIEDSLLYFFIFVGRDDKCTSFLEHILKNNTILLINLCPLQKDNIEINEEQIENEDNINDMGSFSMIIDNEEFLKRKKKTKKIKIL